MQARFIPLLRLALDRDPVVSGKCRSVAIYLRSNRRWLDEEAQLIDTPNDLLHFVNSNMTDPYVKTDQKKVYLFPIQQRNIVVLCRFIRSPHATTCDQIRNKIDEARLTAQAHYDSQYDKLTGLLTRGGLEKEFDRNYRVTTTLQNDSPNSPGISPVPPDVVTLISFDIDYFKKINDHYRHQYGDIVLYSLSRRIDLIVRKFKNNHPYISDVLLARPGGEEFSIVIFGQQSVSQEQAIAEGIRATIHDDPLPNDTEFDDAIEHLNYDITPPPIKERNVTISVGISRQSLRSAASVSKEKALSELSDTADVALYKAKAFGRNMTVHFLDIYRRFGSVVEVDENMGIAAIDLGSFVGVERGNEFLVYLDQYRGSQPLTLSDGRSSRKIGEFPKIPCARLEVFDVQRDVSFCNIIYRRNNASISIQSRVEPIAAGDPENLYDSEKPFLALRELSSNIATKNNTSAFYIIDYYLDLYGAASYPTNAEINKLIRRVIDIARINSEYLIVYYGDDGFALVKFGDLTDDANLVSQRLLAELRSALNSHVTGRNVSMSTYKRPKNAGPGQYMDLGPALNACRNLSYYANIMNYDCAEYSDVILKSATTDLRFRKNLPDVTIAFSTVFLVSCNFTWEFLNQIGLSYWAKRDTAQAIQWMKRASTLTDNPMVPKRNEAYLHYASGNFKDSFALYHGSGYYDADEIDVHLGPSIASAIETGNLEILNSKKLATRCKKALKRDEFGAHRNLLEFVTNFV